MSGTPAGDVVRLNRSRSNGGRDGPDHDEPVKKRRRDRSPSLPRPASPAPVASSTSTAMDVDVVQPVLSAPAPATVGGWGRKSRAELPDFNARDRIPSSAPLRAVSPLASSVSPMSSHRTAQGPPPTAPRGPAAERAPAQSQLDREKELRESVRRRNSQSSPRKSPPVNAPVGPRSVGRPPQAPQPPLDQLDAPRNSDRDKPPPALLLRLNPVGDDSSCALMASIERS